MKRFLPYILIFSVVLQFFAPFTIDTKKSSLNIEPSMAFAEDVEVVDHDFLLDIKGVATDKTATLTITPKRADTGNNQYSGVYYGNNFKVQAILYLGDEEEGTKSEEVEGFTPIEIEFKKLDPDTEYKVNVKFFGGQTTSQMIGDAWVKSTTYNTVPLGVRDFNFKTNPKGEKQETTMTGGGIIESTQSHIEKRDGLPECGFSSVSGCIARIIYYLFYMPTSFLFGLAGTAMDYTLMYSLSDGSYRTPFVSEGWKIVRDLCNMFFIFVLLYIAFTTILDTAGSKNKSTVINVVIIGLVINFSLFATHLIIDASNILARVFYNPKIVDIEKVENGQSVKVGLDEDYKYIRISETIVSKINPQNLLDTKTQNIATSSGQNKEGVESGEEDGISTGSFILVTIMASIVNIMGMMAFLSIALSFIGRVVGLWIAMVLSPMAFLTFTIPQLKNVQYIGWTKWWSETLKTAFMAPVFVFFLYIILMFLESGLGIASSAQKGNLTGLNHILSIVIPFILILVLLKQAQKIANNMAGEISGMVTGGIKAVGGVALGATALGVGALGRNIIGKTMAKTSQGETSVQKYEAAKKAQLLYNDNSLMDKLSGWQKTKGAIASYTTGGHAVKVKDANGNVLRDQNNKEIKDWKNSVVGKIAGQTTIAQNISTRKVEELGVDKGIGGLVTKKQKKVEEIEKARSKYDEAKKEAGFENTPDENLSAENMKKVKGKFKDKNKGDFEKEAKNGDISLRNANGAELLDGSGRAIRSEKVYKEENKNRVSQQYIAEYNANALAQGQPPLNPNQTLTGPHKKKVEQMLNMEFNAILKTTIDHRSNEKFIETRNKASEKISTLDRGVAGANTASYDVRNLTKLKADKKDGLFNKIPVALIAAIATGVRTGMKGLGLSNGGVQVNKSLGKDLGSVITDSLKSANININIGDKKK